ncbi:MAG: protein kinase [Bacteroidales bacterium]|nr:protein kinase [Bacteroidales bacterium]
MSEVLNHLQPGTMLRGDTYRIVRFIAAGGFGCTYEAEHVLLEKRVAIKEFFMQDYCNREDYTNRVTVGTKSKFELVDKYKRKFIGEAKALSGLEHEGIVRVSDVFEENGTAYFVMDYVDGQPLSGLCKNGPLPEKHALYYTRQVCEALAYVHDHNRLHLDIKPGNIMVKSDGRTVLIDFGASKQYEPTTGENNSSMPGLTPGYAPLEQTQGDVRQFFPATDIYALGATLYCLLTGRAPQSPANRLNDEEDDLALPANISAATRHAVECALEIRKKDRPQSVREFMALLDAAVKVEPIQSDVVPKPAPAKAKAAEDPKAGTIRTEEIVEDGNKPARRRRNLWLRMVGGLIVAAMIAGIVYMLNKPSEILLDDTPATGTHEGHEWVDMGLSVKWATCNVGASSPTGYGNYYAWGETSTMSSYDRDNCKTWERSMSDIRGNSSYDAARANWGGNWRLPTKAECDELINNCDQEWTTQNGVKGMLFTSKRNGNSIFLPAAGWRYGTSTECAGDIGTYWSSTPYESNTQDAYRLGFDSGGSAGTDCLSRYWGRTVRPVVE